MSHQPETEMASRGSNPMIDLESFDEESGTLNVIIDTPKGSRTSSKYDERSEIFKLGGALPLGVVFLLTSATSRQPEQKTVILSKF